MYHLLEKKTPLCHLFGNLLFLCSRHLLGLQWHYLRVGRRGRMLMAEPTMSITLVSLFRRCGRCDLVNFQREQHSGNTLVLEETLEGEGKRGGWGTWRTLIPILILTIQWIDYFDPKFCFREFSETTWELITLTIQWTTWQWRVQRGWTERQETVQQVP